MMRPDSGAGRDKDRSLHPSEPGAFNPEGFSLWFGHGKVNAFKAVKAARTGCWNRDRKSVV